MSIENKIYQHLSTSATLTAYTSARIYPLIIPSNILPEYPAVIYSRISGLKINSLSGFSSLENVHIQIDCYSTAYAVIKAMSTVILALMETAPGIHSYCITDYDVFENEASVYRNISEFSIWNQE